MPYRAAKHSFGRKGRVAALALCALLVFVTVFSAALIAIEADHDCQGEDCHICRAIKICEYLLSRGLLVLAPAFASALAAVFASGRVQLLSASASLSTPVSLRVRLND